jgi:phosphoribosylformylglycinamidine synthase
MGKFVVVSIDAASEDEARTTTDEICRKLLANPVMEEYAFEIVKGG